ncbi:unnamed protein product [Cylindrotheca closterium]|uniref:Serine hydrolase domain-containing protein n=1 Tax=Cylindrotheca closterium TaxID=2856 RepID=A0AAD2CK63_9STRA|nr:unnamed protein product [Cylindrotheca closterium]
MTTSAALDNDSKTEILRVLALHGSEGNAEEFSERLIPLQNVLGVEHDGTKIQMEITSLQAPFAKGGGYAWWTMPPGIRSYTAKEYEGFEESATRLLDQWNLGGDDGKPFDLVLGHSQGAILLASMIALGRTPYSPSMGYILNGCGYCRPFEEQVKTLKPSTKDALTRCLFVIGANDQVTPPTIQEELRDAFQAAGLEVATLKHSKGHGLPKEKDTEAIQQMADWILRIVH